MAIPSLGQQDFSFLQPVENNKYKKVLKQAKKEGKSVLFIAYSAQTKPNSLLNLEPSPQLQELSKHVLTSIADWNIHTRNELFNRVDIPTNPYYIFMHPDDVILHTSTAINGHDELIAFVGQGLNKRKKYDNLVSMTERGDTKAYKELALTLFTNKEYALAREVLDEWIQLSLPLKEEKDFMFLAAAHQQCKCSDRVDQAMDNYQSELINLIGSNDYYDIRQSYILTNLREAGLLEPFYVWESYDNHLGEKADSLYRLFAIEYFRSVLPDKQVMLDEIYNFLYYYPNTPWEDQKGLFNIAIKSTEHDDDWLLLLDLIEYQILTEDSYSKKDYKSYILHKLGHVDRAIELMSEVEGEALQENADFQPLLFQLINQN
jgi:hypothetical protein